MDFVKGLESFIEKSDPNYLDLIRQMRQFGIIGQSQKIIQAFMKLQKAAKSYANVLIEGESGTGKDLFAQAVHSLSPRNGGPMVKLNCAEIPENLLESELFGYERGAFTGATKRKIGKFELANTGTIFLDEISEMSLSLQSKMLRVIEDKVITRVGGLENIPIDVRIVSATNRDLWQHTTKGRFREDLYYRLNVIYLHLPALRERKEDIPLLIDHFIKAYKKVENTQIDSMDENAVKILLSFGWSGNVRQLENAIHHAIIMTYDRKISIDDIPENIISSLSGVVTSAIMDYAKKDHVVITNLDLNEMEKSQIVNALDQSRWNISEAAKILGIHRNTLSQKMKRLSIH